MRILGSKIWNNLFNSPYCLTRKLYPARFSIVNNNDKRGFIKRL